MLLVSSKHCGPVDAAWPEQTNVHLLRLTWAMEWSRTERHAILVSPAQRRLHLPRSWPPGACLLHCHLQLGNSSSLSTEAAIERKTLQDMARAYTSNALKQHSPCLFSHRQPFPQPAANDGARGPSSYSTAQDTTLRTLPSLSPLGSDRGVGAATEGQGPST